VASPRGKSGRANETFLSSQVFKEKEEKEMMLRLSPFHGTRGGGEVDVKKTVIEVDDFHNLPFNPFMIDTAVLITVGLAVVQLDSGSTDGDFLGSLSGGNRSG